MRILFLLSMALAGAACARWMPAEWLLSGLGYSLLVVFILAVLLTVDAKNERRAPMPLRVMFEVLWLPSRDADVKPGPAFWGFILTASFLTGFLGCMLFLPIYS